MQGVKILNLVRDKKKKKNYKFFIEDKYKYKLKNACVLVCL
jgi:hypothetical protein